MEFYCFKTGGIQTARQTVKKEKCAGKNQEIKTRNVLVEFINFQQSLIVLVQLAAVALESHQLLSSHKDKPCHIEFFTKNV